MSVLQNATKHFADQLTGELKSVTVPEWQTDVYYKPINSFAIESKIIELTQKGKITEALIETLILKALDANGKPMFNKFDKVTLMNEVDPAVITRVVGQINATDSVDFTAVEKN
jgi:hypothetical protein